MTIFSTILLIAFVAVQLWVMSYFIIVVLFALLDLFKIKRASKEAHINDEKQYSFAAIITLHKNIQFVTPITDALLKQHHEKLHIFIIADDCPAIHLPFTSDRIHIIYPKKPLHSKIKSIQLALTHIDEKSFDAIAIFDPDNLIHPEFFTVINKCFQQGYRAVQSNILPKNFDTSIARLDALNDQYYNFIDRYEPTQLGLCAHIGGRGTVINIQLYKSISYTSFLGGFDKKLQCELAKQTKIIYAQDAKLYDEKVTSGDDLQHQRTRWINTYFKYFKEGFDVFMYGIKKMKPYLIFFGYNLLRPPLFIQLFLMVVSLLLGYFLTPLLFKVWLIVLVLYFISFVYIIHKAFSLSTCIKIIAQTPVFFIRQVRALFNIKKANKKFMQTNNSTVVFIDDVLKTNS